MKDLPDPIEAELKLAVDRGILPTTLGTAEIRAQIAAELRVKSFFMAQCPLADYLSKAKLVIDKMAAGEIGEGQARTALYKLIEATGYTPEGGFPDLPPGTVPPAVKGTLQDLSSYRRVNLIVRTQFDLFHGRAQQLSGSSPERLAGAPAWELVRIEDRNVPRDWPSRWKIAGGSLVDGGRMIALKGDPIWGELGSSGNFQDALDVDHPPFAFESGMGWREIDLEESRALELTGPEGESIEEFLASQPQTLLGPQALPTPRISMKDVDPDLVAAVKKATGATADPENPTTLVAPTKASRYAALRKRILEEEAARQAATRNGGTPP
jgi:hypothetical protein